MRPATPTADHRDREELAELVARVDLAALVEEYAGPGQRQGVGWVYSCPHPGHPDAHPSFTVKADPHGVERGKCWSVCAWSGDALDLVQWLRGCDVAEAAQYLRARTGTPDHYRPTGPRPVPPRARPSAPLAPLPEGPARPPAEAAARLMAGYLQRRGWPAEAADRFGLEVVLDTRGRPAIRHPFYVPSGAGVVVASWQDRATSTAGPKWVAPAGRPLPPWNVAALEAEDVAAVILCEGPADAIAATLALGDAPGVVALGIPGVKGWRSSWAEMLTGLLVVVAADEDTAGTELRATLHRDLTGHAARVVDLHLSTANDLGELYAQAGPEVVRRLLLAATSSTTTEHEPSPQEEADDGADLFGDLTAEPDPPPPQAGHRCAVCSTSTTTEPLCTDCTTLGRSGPHRWQVCTVCATWNLTATGKSCTLTPGCSGTYTLAQEVTP
jgi:hypothetical protein